MRSFYIFSGIIAAMLVLISVSTSDVLAQRTGTGTTGTGNTGSGNTGTGNTGGGNTGGGNTGGGNIGRTGNTGGGGGGGTNNFIQDFSLDGGGSMTTGNNATNAFIGVSGGNTFVGNTAGGTTAARGTTNARNTMTANRNRNTNTAGRTGQGGGNSFNAQTQVQPVITLGFAIPQRNFSDFSTAVNNHITRMTTQYGRLGAVQVEVAGGGVAFISGSVASDYDRKVAENLLRLQPGVSKIESDIQIGDALTVGNPLSPSVSRSPQINTTPTAQQPMPLAQPELPIGVPNWIDIIESSAKTPQGQQLLYIF